MKDNTINSSGPFAGLYGCDILSAIVSALDIDDEILAGRTARRFFDGESINEHNRLQIFGALGQALIELRGRARIFGRAARGCVHGYRNGPGSGPLMRTMGSPDGQHPEPCPDN